HILHAHALDSAFAAHLSLRLGIVLPLNPPPLSALPSKVGGDRKGDYGRFDGLPRTPLAGGPAILDNSRMTVALIRYDAARRALAAAHRVDEVKAIRDKAEAVRTYAKLAGDLQLQNQACEIRLRAERRAGQLLLEMEKNPGRRGEGRPRKDGTKFTRSASASAYPPKLEDIGVSKDQSSKWQRLALLVGE